MNYKKIKTLAGLDLAIKRGHHEFAIVLSGGAVISRKVIHFFKNGKYAIENCVDDTNQKLTVEQIMNRGYSNIGHAMKEGAFIQLKD